MNHGVGQGYPQRLVAVAYRKGGTGGGPLVYPPLQRRVSRGRQEELVCEERVRAETAEAAVAAWSLRIRLPRGEWRSHVRQSSLGVCHVVVVKRRKAR